MMSITLWIFVGWLLSLSLTLTELFQNHVEWILPAFFNCLHLWDNWWFSWHMLSETKSLPEKLSWVKTFWFITEVLSVNEEAMFLLPTFEFNNDSVLFLQTVTCLKIIRFHRMSGWWQCSANVAFKNIITNCCRNRIYLQWFTVMMILRIVNGVPLQLDDSFTQ